MEREKRKRTLVKPARDTLSEIDKALADIAENTAGKKKGEFTTLELSKSSGKHACLVRHDADKMVALGKWVKRKAGRSVFYRRA
jgi:hypothetical protein